MAIIRWILTVGLLVGVYSETGVFTVGILALIAIANELQAYSLK